MKIYNYHNTTKEYLCESIADKDPLDKDNFLAPANSTIIKPLDPKMGFTCIFNGKEWEYRDNRVYILYNTQTLERLKSIGEPNKEGYTALKPFEFSRWNINEWVVDLELFKNDVLGKVKKDFETKVGQLVGDATSTEISSWKTQEEEAVNYLKDNTTHTPFIDSLMLSRTDKKDELCSKIVYKANSYKQYYPLFLGDYHSKIKKIELAISVDELTTLL